MAPWKPARAELELAVSLLFIRHGDRFMAIRGCAILDARFGAGARPPDVEA